MEQTLAALAHSWDFELDELQDILGFVEKITSETMIEYATKNDLSQAYEIMIDMVKDRYDEGRRRDFAMFMVGINVGNTLTMSKITEIVVTSILGGHEASMENDGVDGIGSLMETMGFVPDETDIDDNDNDDDKKKEKKDPMFG